jgi:hypothetical protein
MTSTAYGELRTPGVELFCNLSISLSAFLSQDSTNRLATASGPLETVNGVSSDRRRQSTVPASISKPDVCLTQILVPPFALDPSVQMGLQ